MVYPTVWFRAREKKVPDSVGPNGEKAIGGTETAQSPRKEISA
jgi:hypothetical protein